MRTLPLDYRSDQRLFGLAATVAVHLAVIACWWLARQVEVDADGTPAESIQWIDIPLVQERAKPAPAPAPPPPPVAQRKTPTPPARMTPVTPAPPKPGAALETMTEQARQPETAAAPQAAPASSAYDMMQQARRDIGKIDKDLKKEFPERGIKAPPTSPQIRLEKGIELANELAPPKWYEKAKIKELIDPGGYGRRRYRVITSGGVQCWTYDSFHAPNGGDPFNPRRTPKVTNCPEHEEPAKEQKW